MPTRVRLTTFNCENLFNRYALLDEPWENRNYERLVMAVGLASIASREGDLVSYATTDIQRNNTAMAIVDSQPDVLVVQEVENLYTLRNFNHEYLDDYFDQMILVDGNDPRGIDVGILVKREIGRVVAVRSHMDDLRPNASTLIRSARRQFGYMAEGAMFSRDCLEVDIDVGGKVITILANHLKAQDRTPQSVDRRREQAEAVATIVTQNIATGRFPIVMGDLNYDTKLHVKNGDNDKSLDPLVFHPSLADPFSALPAAEQWTHFYESGKDVSRLDYILPDERLTVRGPPTVIRKGLSTKCKAYTGPRYATIGPKHTEASDHCPVTIEIEV
jgi:endonuclease/exonuclease/phosphatase family metal-dependent hydrolase